MPNVELPTGDVVEFPEGTPPEMMERAVKEHLGELPPKTPYSGLHFAEKPIKNGFLMGAMRGSSGVGSESKRLLMQPTAPPGSYVYDAGTIAEPQIAKRGNLYEVNGNYALADISKDPQAKKVWSGAFQKAILDGAEPPAATNAAENALREHGYDGYRNSASKLGHVVFLFGDQPVTPAGNPQVQVKNNEG